VSGAHEPDASARPEVDFLDGRFYAHHQHEAYRWMRRHEPLFQDPGGLWGVTLHEDVMAVSKDAVSFCSGKGFRPDGPIMPMMINMDRLEHMTRRGLVNRGFTPRSVMALEPRIPEITSEILDSVCERGSCDFVRDVAAHLPLIVIGDLLGVAVEDRSRLLEWSDATMSGTGNPDPHAMKRATRAFQEYSEYC
jgi:cytochrome P450 family 142 subfamily A polypeptide 1